MRRVHATTSPVVHTRQVPAAIFPVAPEVGAALLVVSVRALVTLNHFKYQPFLVVVRGASANRRLMTRILRNSERINRLSIVDWLGFVLDEELDLVLGILLLGRLGRVFIYIEDRLWLCWPRLLP